MSQEQKTSEGLIQSGDVEYFWTLIREKMIMNKTSLYPWFMFIYIKCELSDRMGGWKKHIYHIELEW